MYGIGIFEIFLIILVMLLFFKPEEIFGLFRRLGRWYRKVKGMEDNLKNGWKTGSAENDVDFGFDVDEAEEEGENL